MYVCVCNAVTDSDIRNAVDNGVHSMWQLLQETGCAGTCGCCRDLAVEILQESLADTLSRADSRQPQLALPILQIA